MKKFLIICFLILDFAICMAQSVQQNLSPSQVRRERERARRKAEKKTEKFDMGYFYNPANRHYLLKFQILDTTLIPIMAGVAIGNIPYKPNSGSVQISYYNGNRLLGQYFTQDPTVIRSCDSTQIGIKVLPDSTFVNVQLPYNENITRIEISGTRISPNRVIDYQIRSILDEAN